MMGEEMIRAYKTTNSSEIENNHSLFLTTQALDVQRYYHIASLKLTKGNAFLSDILTELWNSLPQDAKEDKN